VIVLPTATVLGQLALTEVMLLAATVTVPEVPDLVVS
jgi:hypothetical protein